VSRGLVKDEHVGEDGGGEAAPGVDPLLHGGRQGPAER
jgi:hypothetical protein